MPLDMLQLRSCVTIDTWVLHLVHMFYVAAVTESLVQQTITPLPGEAGVPHGLARMEEVRNLRTNFHCVLTHIDLSLLLNLVRSPFSKPVPSPIPLSP